MKKIIYTLLAIACTIPALAQDVSTNITTAKSAYKAGNLEEAHFALQKAMQEIDILIGKEVLKLLPVKLDTLTANTAQDNVGASAGFFGATIQRRYGTDVRGAELSIISNSPMVAVLNSFLNMPIPVNMNDGSSKTIKLQGYKARLERKTGNEDGKFNYELQIPLGSALISFTVDNTTEAEMVAWANTIPLSQIAKLIQ